jgi:hypothetical protein
MWVRVRAAASSDVGRKDVSNRGRYRIDVELSKNRSAVRMRSV